jgi:hypothetical protein
MGQNQENLTSTYNGLNNRCESCFKSMEGKEYKGCTIWVHNALSFKALPDTTLGGYLGR